MKIELIKQKFNGCCGYKYKPFEYCCERIKDNPLIEFVDELCEGSDDTLPTFALHYIGTLISWGEEFEQDTYFKINFCPFCGEPIEISVIGEEEVDDAYQELNQQRGELRKKQNRTDSIKKAHELYDKIHALDEKIDWFYQLVEYKDKRRISKCQ